MSPTFAILLIIGMYFSHVHSSPSECYHCRLSACSHEYCSLVDQTIEGSGLNGLTIDEWNKIPICPPQFNESNNKEYIEKCHTGQKCGKILLHFITTSVKSITPRHNSSIPVLASGKETYESDTSIFGCISPDYKCPTQELSKDFHVPSTDHSEKTNVVTITNKELNCCNCDTNLCNGADQNLNCNQVTPMPGLGSNSGAFIGVNFSFVLFVLIGTLFHSN